MHPRTRELLGCLDRQQRILRAASVAAAPSRLGRSAVPEHQSDAAGRHRAVFKTRTARHRALGLFGLSLVLLLATSVGVAAAPQESKDNSPAGSPAPALSKALTVSLRLLDDSPFAGVANVRVTSPEGQEVSGVPSGADGETDFANIPPGKYTVEANAPGFLPVRQETQIEPGNRVHQVFLIMKPMPVPAAAEPFVPATAPTGKAKQIAWVPPDIDAVVPAVEKGVECPLPQVVSGVGRRMKELVDNLQKFDATEHMENFPVDSKGVRGKADERTFDYIVNVKVSEGQVAGLEEYRNGSLDPKLFPDKFATTGVPTMALAFHPAIVSEFSLTCEGLGQWDSHPAWQVHFAQRPDRPNRLRSYLIEGRDYPVALQGRVWIDAATFQIRHFESELINPVDEIGLTQERITINYGPVEFRGRTEQLWLPLFAELYWERGARRLYRRHTYSDFKLFEVASNQVIEDPEGSYCFMNTSDHDIAGILIVSPVAGGSAQVASVRFTIPAGQSVCKLIGLGKDVNMPVDAIGSATFMHNGRAGSIKANANLVRESALDLVPETDPATVKP
jgi:Carboxypeptidase regulatory-like domain